MIEIKDSGVEWVGIIPKEWSIVRNKNVFENEKLLVGEKSSTTQLLSLTTKGIKEKDINNPNGKLPESFDTYQFVKKDEIVMCLFDLDCSAVFSGISPFEGMISSAYKVLKCKSNMIPQYAEYWFKYISDGRKFNHYAKNIRYTLNIDEFFTLPILLPPIKYQEKIVGYLDYRCSMIDQTIKKQKSLIEKLKSYKQSLITEVVTKGLDSYVPMKDSGIEWIGEIPEHWEVIRMKWLGTSKNGLTYKPEDTCEENNGVLVLRSSNIQNGQLTLTDNVYINMVINNNLMVKKGDILICSRNGSKSLIGKNIIIDDDIHASFGAFMMVFSSENSKYIYYLLNSEIFNYYLGTFLTSTINQLTLGNFNNMKVVYCKDIIEQNRIMEYLDDKCIKIEKVISNVKSTIIKLEAYKKSLIYECVTGKREVK